MDNETQFYGIAFRNKSLYDRFHATCKERTINCYEAAAQALEQWLDGMEFDVGRTKAAHAVSTKVPVATLWTVMLMRTLTYKLP